jgi:hypothetical protein
MRAEELKRKAADADTAQHEMAAVPLDDTTAKTDSRTASRSRGLGVF